MWYEIRIDNCPLDNIEIISDHLEEGGALSLTLTDKNDDPVLEPLPGTTPLWPEVIITALYNEENLARNALQDLHKNQPFLSSTFSFFDDQNWVLECIKDFKPQCFGQRLWVCPNAASIQDPAGINLILPPGLAFGTGTHPTTNLCLNWLSQNPMTGKTLIDYGCGSGILALSAIKLGATLAYAIDIDPQALEATRMNALTNDLTENLKIGQAEILQQPVDFIIANILLSPLLDLKNTFLRLLKPGGSLVVTGLLSPQAETIVLAYQSDFTKRNTFHLENWALVEFVKEYRHESRL